MKNKEIYIDWSKLSRNYEKQPLKKTPHGLTEIICYEDFKYLCEHYYYTEIQQLLKCCDRYLYKRLKEYNLTIKKNGRKALVSKEEKELAKYGVIGLSKKEKLNITINKEGREEFFKKKAKIYKETWSKRNKEDEEKRIAKRKETCLQRYGDENYNNREQFKETMLDTYGIETMIVSKEVLEKTHSPECIEKQNVSREKFRSTLTPDDYKRMSDKGKKTFFEKTGYTHWSYDPTNPHKDWKEKREATLRKNKTFNCSKFEKQIQELLNKKFENVKKEYKEERYPFHCDFYVPNLDLFIEYQGHWSHGFKPFEGTEEDLKLIEKWKSRIKPKNSYAGAIEVWTVRDVKKRNWAKEHNLNWIEFFNFDEFMSWYNTL